MGAFVRDKEPWSNQHTAEAAAAAAAGSAGLVGVRGLSELDRRSVRDGDGSEWDAGNGQRVALEESAAAAARSDTAIPGQQGSGWAGRRDGEVPWCPEARMSPGRGLVVSP